MMYPNTSDLDNLTLNMLQNKAVSITLPAVYVLVVVINIPCNLVSFYVLCCHTKPITPSVIFMINLSITDIAVGVFLPFQIIYHLNNNNWIFGSFLCNLVAVSFYANMYSSILTMTFISIERYIGVVHPMASNRWRKNRYAVAACTVMWAFLLLVLYPLESTDLTYEVKSLGIVTCFDILKWSMLPNIPSWAAFILTLFVVLFLIPFIVTVSCYIGIIRKLIQTSSRYGNGQKRKSMYLAAIVLIVFITCFAPNNFVLLVHTISRLFYDKSFYHVYKITLTLSCLSSCADPFIYYFASKEFLQNFKKLFRKSSIEATETRRDSLFSARSMSARSMTFSSGQGEGLEVGKKPIFHRQESIL
ncbi:P2Y purinoceptor 8 [Microcaecilia unicolor]|uniref:P2Y purinoceptor 8-like n=1 Tax=Microcaecilia unicolor TaxID=1415580 RepID=A0A6P7XJ36_9AMPH|nr:P2Y purinoceptor 8-like [Microcaecilia unicolor]XP_030055511.1 P2Y purinoceptor 8-like [Microcaecilia unicolor]XP_030055512.1 P2Y purinoceptor 8-like [Microcaecilia unicolor]XP_030055513.1 P2Y purinoceptor 8-like [Microcaecilia unicolor]